MPKRTNAFQRVVTLITASLAGQAKVTESAMIEDSVTHEEREVDILISTHAANYDVKIGIEVVAWNRPAGTPWVEKMRAKHENLDIDKLILISQSGFSKPALVKADFYNIECLTLEAACQADWPRIAMFESTGVFELTNLKYECAVICEFEDGTREKIEAPVSTPISLPTGDMTLDEFVRSIINHADFKEVLNPHIKGTEEQRFWFSYTQSGGLWKFKDEERSGQVQELRVDLKVLRSETPIQYAAGRFRQSPFIAGVSTKDASPLQFALVKTPDGDVNGYLVGEDGVLNLKADEGNQGET